MDRKFWQSVKRPFDTKCQGRFVLILGPAKMGKTTVLSQLYRHFDPEGIFWISGGELDGWRVVKKTVGREPGGSGS
jgi:ABC-type cobalamin/Fe3+-siderophores transport system ATPase subunit